jgi:hypothetical protein
MDYWQLYDNVKSFEKLDDQRKKEIINSIFTQKMAARYNYPLMVSLLIKHLDDALAIKLFDYFVTYGNHSYNSDDGLNIINYVYGIPNGRNTVINILKKSKSKKLLRSLLMLDDISHEEEEIGLRALAGVKCAPDGLFINKYKPSVEVIKKLPPVMRLKVIESLLSNDDISYDILANFSKPDEFKSLLFGAVLRHNIRVNTVWDKYNETKHRATKSATKVHGNCENCGDYSITIKSTRMGTQSGFDSTRIGRSLKNSGCALCGRWSQKTKKVTSYDLQRNK